MLFSNAGVSLILHLLVIQRHNGCRLLTVNATEILPNQPVEIYLYDTNYGFLYIL